MFVTINRFSRHHVRSQDVDELGYTCMFSPIHSASLVGRNCQAGAQGGASESKFRYAYSSHARSAGTERSILSGVTTDTASVALDPGEWRMFLLADHPGKQTDQEKSKYERYTQSMVMTGIYWYDFMRMRYAEYILKLKNLYMFYIKHILPGLVDVLGIYL